jgi:hypothetical protein
LSTIFGSDGITVVAEIGDDGIAATAASANIENVQVAK